MAETPLRGLTMRTPKTLPRMPAADGLRVLVQASGPHLEGVRNRALVLTLAESGLQASEVLHLTVEDWRASDRSLFVHAGKGRKGRIAFVGPTTARPLFAQRKIAVILEILAWRSTHGYGR